MLKHILPVLLCLLLLSGCAGQPSPSAEVTPTPTAETLSPAQSPLPEPPSGSVRVEAHWDMLEERARPLARRWYEEYTDDLLPADGYGPLVPYIGGEKLVRWGWPTEDGSPYVSSEYLYGFATAHGVMVTDAVFDSIYAPAYYDVATASHRTLPLWVVTRTVISPEGEPHTAAGVAAQDGSWYTGLVFSSSDLAYGTPHVISCETGLLMLETPERAVMIGLDGTERYRLTADQFLSPNSEARSWFFSGAIHFGLQQRGPYWSFQEALIYGSEVTGEPIWLDSRTGIRLDGQPDDVPTEPEDAWTRTFFSGGWHDCEDTSVLYFDDGTVLDLTLTLPKYLAMPRYVAPPLLIFEDEYSATVTDLEGNILFRWDVPEGGFHSISLLSSPGEDPPLVQYHRWDDPDSYIPVETVLSPEGIIYSGRVDVLTAYGDTLSIVEPEWYLLLDIRGNELLRLPRVAMLDHPADD